MTTIKSIALRKNSKKLKIILSFITIFYSFTVYSHGVENPHQGLKPKVLALGDGKISSIPKKGYVMACNTRFNGVGAHRVGEWISNGAWQTDVKPIVEGKVAWPNAQITIAQEQAQRVVMANNLPTHTSGVYPVNPQSLAFQYDRNPNTIREQAVLLRLPAEPQIAPSPYCIPMGMIGFAVSGVAISNAFDAAGRDAPAYEVQDACNGHPQRSGQYHYHDWSPCLYANKEGRAYASDEPVGWMLDGFPILGPINEKGKVVTNEDLDECHGQTGNVKINGKLQDMYHYRFTFEYPYTVGCFKGAPVELPRTPPSQPVRRQ